MGSDFPAPRAGSSESRSPQPALDRSIGELEQPTDRLPQEWVPASPPGSNAHSPQRRDNIVTANATTELDYLAEQHPIGSTFGKFLITGLLGRGSSAVVLRAIHQTLNIPVAIKFVRPSAREKNPNLYDEFKRESQLLARLNHPHIVRVWDFEDHCDYPYIVLEYVDGLNLQELLNQTGRITAERAVAIIEQATLGLIAAWEIGVIHRDVKPGNILLSRGGPAKLVDLGLAFIGGDPDLSAAGGERANDLVGTAAYMAPEQSLSPGEIDYRADIYSLGATFYHAVTEQIPFPARNAREAILKHITEPLPPADRLAPDLPEEVSRVIDKMMAKNPSHRYQDGEELLDALAALQEVILNGPPMTPPVPITQVKPANLPPPPVEAEPKPSTGTDTHLVSQETSRTACPLSPEARVEQGIDAARRGQVAEAIGIFQDITNQYPFTSAAWMWLAMLSTSPKESMVYYQRLLEITPDHELAQQGLTRALVDVGVLEAEAGKEDTARGLFHQAVEREPRLEKAWLWLGRLAPDDAEARECFQVVLAINPHHAEAQAELRDLDQETR